MLNKNNHLEAGGDDYSKSVAPTTEHQIACLAKAVGWRYHDAGGVPVILCGTYDSLQPTVKHDDVMRLQVKLCEGDGFMVRFGRKLAEWVNIPAYGAVTACLRIAELSPADRTGLLYDALTEEQKR